MKFVRLETIGNFTITPDNKDSLDYCSMYCSMLINRELSNYNEEEEEKLLDKMDLVFYRTTYEQRNIMKSFSKSLKNLTIDEIKEKQNNIESIKKPTTKIESIFITSNNINIPLSKTYKINNISAYGERLDVG